SQCQQEVMTTCFTAICCATAAALCSDVAVTRLGNLTGEGSALTGPTVVPEPGETALLLLGLCLIIFELHCRRSAARKRELEQERDGERSGVSPRFPHPSR